MKDILKRINELAQKKKNEGLTESEVGEMNELRQKYLDIFRGSMQELLLNTTVVDPEGADVTPKKLRTEQARNRKKAIWSS
ncbi:MULTISPECIES: DUF896 domain-containing protein [Mesobacillus]|uniref:UPF0291 protein GWK17_10005 n=1 Tax=Mesobacillus selenatarsenatis TaxID=388741 RepID=A0A846TNQ4_9BACI|nr:MULTISPECIES: DUF896 domain-containing protein [Mesobacillus]NKE05795.1 DUF896 domain-containing protein [Mesobacillus selenatarsenatis]